MPFFEDIDSIGLLERNANKIESLELNQVRKLIGMFKQAKSELITRLMFAEDNTFTEARLNSTIAQIDVALNNLQQRLNQQLRFGFDLVFENGVEDSVKELNKFEKEFNGVSGLIPLDPILESLEPDNFLFNQYQSSIETYSQSLRQEFQRVLGQSLLQQRTWTQAVNDINTVFASSEWRLARIVRTELHGIYNVSKLKGFQESKRELLPDLQKTLFHPIDSRTGDDSVEANRKNLIVDLDKPFVYTFNQGDKKITRRFMSPPDRPNDRSILLPYRKSYDK